MISGIGRDRLPVLDPEPFLEAPGRSAMADLAICDQSPTGSDQRVDRNVLRGGEEALAALRYLP
jgi:hypothetical protein